MSATKLPDNYVPLQGSERRPAAAAKRLGEADPNEVFSVTISVRRRSDGDDLPDHSEFLGASRKPKMSEGEFVQRFGAAPEDIAKVVAFAKSHGLSVVETNLASRIVVVRGTVAQMSAAFGVELGRYARLDPRRRDDDPKVEIYRGRDGFVHVPAELEPIIVGVFGLDNRHVGLRNSADPPNTSPVTVPVVAKLYNYPINSATGQTIGIFSLSGYARTDVQAYFNGLPAGFQAPAITDVLVNGATNPGTDPYGETTQDIDIAAAFAPGAAINVYITTSDQGGWVQALERFAHPASGDSPASVLSSSWFIANGDDPAGLGDVTAAFIDAVSAAFADAALQHRTVCIATGDRGTDSNVGDGQVHVQYPASDPWVLSVGGTTIGNVNGSSFDEYVWNDPQAGNWGTTGGGVSSHFTNVPTYQANANVPASLNPPHNTGRGIPDVAGNANIASGYSGIVLGGAPSPNPGNGTSASAPQWAGLIAVINAALGVPVGHVNPAIYQLAGKGFRTKAFASGPLDNSNNGAPGYPAGAPWDACTGWGSPDGQALLAALRPIYASSSTAADIAVATQNGGRTLTDGVIEITLGGGIQVRVDSGVDELALSRVLRAVKAAS